MTFASRVKSANFFRCTQAATFITAIITVIVFASLAFAQGAKQEKFKSPEEAFKALVEAAKTDNVAQMLTIFGPGGKDVISSGDPVADRAARERFVKAAEEGLKFSKLDNKTVLPVIGKSECSFPIPIVKSGRKWVFSTEDGRQEIINRRIGRNELSTIKVALQYADAQREYAGKDRDGDGVLQYAQRFVSHKGKKDGLYWEASAGEENSPLGPLLARAAAEGYPAGKAGWRRKPYHGYYLNILKSQGSNAPGGEKDYVVDGKMTAGFGLVAYPAEYGVSGVMTFMVNQEGVVYEKDLGPKTEEVAKTFSKYDPDKSWKKVEIPAE
jgi:hypothetical protein